MTEPKGVEAVDRALKILECFTPEAPELSLAELANRTGYYKSTLLRLCVSLERFGYVIRGGDGKFRLGPAAGRLGASYRQSFDLEGILRPQLKQLCSATGETASFYIREGSARICLYREEPARAIRHSITEGASMPLDRGASGRILLAFSAKDNSGFAAVRAAGHAVSIGERDSEVAAVSVPVIAASGRLAGALSVSGLITRFTPDRRGAMIEALNSCRRWLEGQITI